MKTFSSNLSFKELCGYGMPISTMFTNGILKADESGTTKIQAPDNAMYNGTSFKTLVAFGLVTEGGELIKDFPVIVDDEWIVRIAPRDPEGDAPGEEYQYHFMSENMEVDVFANTLNLAIDPTGETNQLRFAAPLLGFAKGDGSSFEWEEGDPIPDGIEECDCMIETSRHVRLYKVDFLSNRFMRIVLQAEGIDLSSVKAVWVSSYETEGDGLDLLYSYGYYVENGVRKMKDFQV